MAVCVFFGRLTTFMCVYGFLVMMAPFVVTGFCFPPLFVGRIISQSTTQYATIQRKGQEQEDSSLIDASPKQQQQQVPARFVAVHAIYQGSSSPRQHHALTVDLLENSLATYGRHLSTRDRSFCRKLYATCVRRLGQIDKVIELCQTRQPSSVSSKKKNKTKNRVDLYVQAVLRIGAVQLLFLQTPPHAAVKETVDVLRQELSSSSSSSNGVVVVPPAKIRYVNAILRRLSTREGAELLLTQTSVMDNAAPWLVKEFDAAWGNQATLAIIQAALVESPRCLTVKQQRQQQSLVDATTARTRNDKKLQYVASHFDDCQTIMASQGSLVVLNPPSGKVSHWPLYKQGEWWIQDVSATLPAIVMHSALQKCRPNDNNNNNQQVVDLCAAPGGKTAQLCNFGYQVTAVEVSRKRSQQLRANMQRLNFEDNVDVVVADGTQWVPNTTDSTTAVVVDGVLIDAPCTATGTGSRRPDVLRKNPDYTELLDTQYRLLCHVADNILVAGGVLVYATCSLLKQESEDQIIRFLSRNDSSPVRMEMLPLEAEEVPGFEECIDENGCLRIIPGTRPNPDSLKCNVDGFFVARLRRIN